MSESLAHTHSHVNEQQNMACVLLLVLFWDLMTTLCFKKPEELRKLDKAKLFCQSFWRERERMPFILSD